MTEAQQSGQTELRQKVEQRIGQNLGGVGKLEEVVGIGGMATVYRATTEQGPVAVKMMHEHLADKGSLRKRFLREARILDQVDHPNSIKVFDQGTADGGEAYFVMELLDGWEVEVVWKNKGESFPVPEALEITTQALDCLHAYHKKEILHRDLKPSNLFLTKSGQVKLIDFGVARFRGDDDNTDHTRAGTALGTPAYMAPEQAMGKVDILDSRTDVYGIGAVLFTLLSGRRVHEADSNDETLVMAATEPADSLARHAPDVPTPVVQAVDKALSWDPDDRYETAGEFRRALMRLLDEDGQLTREAQVSDEEADEAEQAISEDAADVVVDISDEAIEAMREMFERIEKTMNTARIYEWEHNKTRQNLERAFEEFKRIVDDELGEVYWQVRPHSFEINDELLWEPEDPFDMIPYNLFLDGFRRMQIRTTFTVDELAQFCQWMILDPEYDLPLEDDLATALWDMQMHSVDAQIVTAPAMIDPDRQDMVTSMTQDLMDEADGFLGEGGAGEKLLQAMRSGAYAEASAMGDQAGSVEMGGLGEDFTTVNKGLIPEKRARQLTKAVEQRGRDWNERLERVFQTVWSESADRQEDSKAAETTKDLVVHYTKLGRTLPLMRILVRSYSKLETSQQRRLFVNEVLTEDIVQDISPAIRQETLIVEEEGEEGSGQLTDDQEKLLKLFGRILKIMPEERFATLLRDFPGASEPFRKTLANYLRRFNLGHERQMADLFEALDANGVKMLMNIIADAETQPAFEVMTSMLEDSDVELRKHALKLLPQSFDVESNQFDLTRQLSVLLEDASLEVRIAALKLARNHSYNRTVPSLAERATSKAFHKLEVAERREILRTLMVLSRSKAKKIAVELATNHGWIPNEDRQKTRVLAMRILGQIGESKEALEAVQKGMGRWRWWNSDEIQECAQSASEDIQKRLERRG
jgi:serine/threonine protein kinase